MQQHIVIFLAAAIFFPATLWAEPRDAKHDNRKSIASFILSRTPANGEDSEYALSCPEEVQKKGTGSCRLTFSSGGNILVTTTVEFELVNNWIDKFAFVVEGERLPYEASSLLKWKIQMADGTKIEGSLPEYPSPRDRVKSMVLSAFMGLEGLCGVKISKENQKKK